MAKPAFLSRHWEADGLTVCDVSEDEVELVESLHRARRELATVDSSFAPVGREVYAGLVRASVEGESEGKPFRLQIIRDSTGQPCGYFHTLGHHPCQGCFVIGMFLISPAQAGKGVGTRVVTGLADQASRSGFDKAHVTVFLANREALRFWVSRGFDRIHKYKSREEGGEPDLFILERSLGVAG